MISVRVLYNHINTRTNHIQYYLTKGLIIFWNWFLELKMDKRLLYYLFFYCFNLFTKTLLAYVYYIDVLFFLAVFKSNLLTHFQHFSKTTSLILNFWSMIWNPYKIPLPVIGVTCMYCKKWLSNGYFCGGIHSFFYTL